MKRYFGMLMAGAIGLLAAGWGSGAVAQGGEGCEYNSQSFCNGVPWSNVEVLTGTTTINGATARCVFITGINGYLNINTDNAPNILVNGLPSTGLHYNNNALNTGRERADGGFYIYAPPYHYIQIDSPSSGEPVCPNLPLFPLTINHVSTGTPGIAGAGVITTSVGGSGGGTHANGATVEYRKGSRTITVTSTDSSSVASWTGCTAIPANSSMCTINLEAEATVTVNYHPPRRITVSRDGSGNAAATVMLGGGAVAAGGGFRNFPHNRSVAIVATAAAGDTVMWTGCATVTPVTGTTLAGPVVSTCNVNNLTADVAVAVTFGPPNIPIDAGWMAWNPGGPGGGFRPAAGNWGDQSWSAVGTMNPLLPWNSGSNALFAGPDAAANIYAITVGTVVPNVASMDFRSNGYLISGGSITSAATAPRTITVGSGVTAAINSVIAGAGAITKEGAGILTIGGADSNTYTGATAITAGIVRAAKRNALGAGEVTLSGTGALELAGAILGNSFIVSNNGLSSVAATTGNEIRGGVALGAAARTITANSPLSITGAISGAGALTKAGTADLILSGVNTYTGTTTVNAGNLLIGAGGATGQLAGPVALTAGTNVIFNRSGSVVQAGAITGAGNLVKRGTGELTLSGANTFTGATEIEAGLISISSASHLSGTSGVRVDSAALLIISPTAGSMDFSRSVTGRGTLRKDGAGTLNLTGAAAPTDYVREVHVRSGTLNVDHTAAGRMRAEVIRVDSGATLSGGGGVGSATTSRITVNGGTIVSDGPKTYMGVMTVGGSVASPGTIRYSGTGTFTVSGTLAMNANSRISVAALPPTNLTDPLIYVTGAITIATTANAGALVITKDLTDADLGEHYILRGGSGTAAGLLFSSVTATGLGASEYDIKQSNVGGTIVVTIDKKTNQDIAKNSLTITNATIVSRDEESGAVSVRFTITGFNYIREHNAGNPQAGAAYIWSKAGSAITSADVVGGLAERHSIAIPVPSAGDAATFQITVPSARIVDDLFYFNANVYWSIDDVETLPDSWGPSRSLYLRDPRLAVTPNGLAISVVDHVVTETGITFNLAVTGHEANALTPGVAHKPSVDSVGIWFKRNGGPIVPADLVGNTLALAGVTGASAASPQSLAALRTAGGAVVFTTGPMAEGTFEDTVYFAIAPRWKGTALPALPASVDTVARPLSVSGRLIVRNPNSPTIVNPCVLTNNWDEDVRTPDIRLTVSAAADFDALAHSVRLELSLDPSMEPLLRDADIFTVGQVVAGTAVVNLTDDEFVGVRRPVYYNIVILNASGVVVSAGVSAPPLLVGREPPLPPANVGATPLGGGRMQITWDMPSAPNNIGDVSKSEVRVWFDTVDVNTNRPHSIAASASLGELNVDGLNPETDYMFTVMLYDVVDLAKPSWNLPSVPVSFSKNSGPAVVFSNIVKIDTVIFNEETSVFTVTYSLLYPRAVPYNLNYVITQIRAGIAEEVYSNKVGITITAEGAKGTFNIPHDWLYDFNTEYRIEARTEDPADGKIALGSSSKSFTTGQFVRQTVLVPYDTTGFVNGGKFSVSTVGWPSSVNAVTCTTIVSRADGGSATLEIDGFLSVGEAVGYRYSAKVADGYDGVMETGNVRFTIGIQVSQNDVPPGYSLDDVRIYRWTGSFWEFTDSTVYKDGYFIVTAGDIATKDDATYRALISTEPLRIALGDGGSNFLEPSNGKFIERQAVPAGAPISEVFRITSNVGNVRAELLTAIANERGEWGPAKSNEPVKSKIRTFNFEIDQINISGRSANYGILAYLIVTDGRNVDTINVSRRVSSDAYPGFPAVMETRKWVPFAAQVVLDSIAPKKLLTELFASPEEFAIYDTLFRLFRWYPNNNNLTEKDRWVEYDGKNDAIFNLTPGRLMWIKTANKVPSFTYGANTTVSLIDNFEEIRLPTKQWTDFVLPFRYDIRLGDLLAATGAKDLEFYKWREVQKGKSNYSTEVVALGDIDVDSSYILEGGKHPFTVYNSGETEIVLRIPPKPSYMSHYAAPSASKGLAKTPGGKAGENGGMWYYTIQAKTENIPELNSVMLGFNAARRKFAVPPTFDDASVALIDEDGGDMGHYFDPAIAQGNKTYRLRFYNDGKQRATFTFLAKPSALVPSGTRTTFVDAVSNELLGSGGSESKISVAAGSHRDVLVMVGSRDYQAKFVADNSANKFRVGAVIVNQPAKSVRIRYFIPNAGINRVEVSIYDLKGRMAWKDLQHVKPAMWNTAEWKSRESRRGAAAAGLYIIRVRAIDAKGKTVAVENRRVTFAR